MDRLSSKTGLPKIMPSSKAKPTRTTNPIHFEDLDPKRFEDLVRELIYDFRDWQTIEATGKGGDDDGFDVRAYERVFSTNVGEDGNETVHPMEGNIWMIQCKRDKAIPPSKIKAILLDIDPDNPPYGYILAAATNFSKKAHDAFREELTKLGVLEFYLWGNAILETELYQPKNDRILFTFFGISNIRRRISRASEIRSEVTNKNRVMRILSEKAANSWILVRDANDRGYPYKSKYKDFDARPRWKDFEVVEIHPRGVIVQMQKCYAFIDKAKKIYDLAQPSFTLNNPYARRPETLSDRQNREKLDLARKYWEMLPRKNQGVFHLNGIIRYEDMLVIDDKGDSWNDLPHIFVDFANGSPVSGTVAYIENAQEEVVLDEYEIERVFPEVFTEARFGRIYDEDGLALPDSVSERFVNFRGGDLNSIYDVDGRFSYLEPNDVVAVRFGQKGERFLQVTYRYKLAGEEILRDSPELTWEVSQQIGRQLEASDIINVIEVRNCYKHEWEEQR